MKTWAPFSMPVIRLQNSPTRQMQAGRFVLGFLCLSALSSIARSRDGLIDGQRDQFDHWVCGRGDMGFQAHAADEEPRMAV